jgi:hypothetical protein
VQRDRFPVIGFIKDPSGVAALYLGQQEGKELRYMGKVLRDGPARSQVKSASNSIRSLVPSRSSRGPSGNLRPRGLSRSSSLTLSTATSLRKASCVPVRSRAYPREQEASNALPSRWRTRTAAVTLERRRITQT